MTFKFPVKYVYYIGSCLIILASIWFLQLGAVRYYTSGSDGLSFELGGVTGTSLVFMLLVYPILKRLFPSKKINAFLCFSVIFLACSSYQVVRMNTAADQLKRFKDKVSDIIIRPLKADSDCCALMQEVYSQREYGEMANLLTLLKGIIVFTNQEDIRLNKVVEDAHLENLLEPRKLCDFESLQEALDTLKTLSFEINESEIRRNEHLALLDEQIVNLPPYKNHPIKKSVLDGYNQKRQQTSVFIADYYRVLKEEMREVQELLSFLVDIPDLYWVEEGKMIFEKETDAQKYNRYLSRIIELSEEEDLVSKKLIDFRQKTVKRMASP